MSFHWSLISKTSNPGTNPFGDCNEHAIYNWYHRHFHAPQFFQSSRKV